MGICYPGDIRRELFAALLGVCNRGDRPLRHSIVCVAPLPLLPCYLDWRSAFLALGSGRWLFHLLLLNAVASHLMPSGRLIGRAALLNHADQTLVVERLYLSLRYKTS